VDAPEEARALTSGSAHKALTILGVDPGSRCTGYGVVSGRGERVAYVDSGSIDLGSCRDRYERLKVIFQEMGRVIARYRPDHFAIEDVFYSKNARSALVLGEARGAAVLAAAVAGIPVFQYSAREIKMAVTGNGAAHKEQVDFMLRRLLHLQSGPGNSDESDALAVALCHAFRATPEGKA